MLPAARQAISVHCSTFLAWFSNYQCCPQPDKPSLCIALQLCRQLVFPISYLTVTQCAASLPGNSHKMDVHRGMLLRQQWIHNTLVARHHFGCKTVNYIRKFWRFFVTDRLRNLQCLFLTAARQELQF